MSIGTKERGHCPKLFCFKTIERQGDKSKVISLSEKLEMFRGFGFFTKKLCNTIYFKRSGGRLLTYILNIMKFKRTYLPPLGATIKIKDFNRGGKTN